MVEITKDGRVYTVPYPCYINDFKLQGWELVKDLRDAKEEPKKEEIKKVEEKEVIVEQPKVEKTVEKSKKK